MNYRFYLTQCSFFTTKGSFSLLFVDELRKLILIRYEYLRIDAHLNHYSLLKGSTNLSESYHSYTNSFKILFEISLIFNKSSWYFEIIMNPFYFFKCHIKWKCNYLLYLLQRWIHKICCEFEFSNLFFKIKRLCLRFNFLQSHILSCFLIFILSIQKSKKSYNSCAPQSD